MPCARATQTHIHKASENKSIKAGVRSSLTRPETRYTHTQTGTAVADGFRCCVFQSLCLQEPSRGRTGRLHYADRQRRVRRQVSVAGLIARDRWVGGCMSGHLIAGAVAERKSFFGTRKRNAVSRPLRCSTFYARIPRTPKVIRDRTRIAQSQSQKQDR